MPAAPIVFGRDFFSVDPRSTAVIVVDMQNGFVAKRATYETPGARTMIPQLERLLGIARRGGGDIAGDRLDLALDLVGVDLGAAAIAFEWMCSEKISRLSYRNHVSIYIRDSVTQLQLDGARGVPAAGPWRARRARSAARARPR